MEKKVEGIWDLDQELLKEKIKGILAPADFIQIGNGIEIKRSGILKILHIARELFNLSIETEKEILEIKDYTKQYMDRNGIQQEFQDTYCIVRTTILVQNKEGLYHRTQSIGSAQLSEVRNKIHNMVALAETRSLKRAIEEIFPNLINDAILEIFGTYSVVDDMEISNQFQQNNQFSNQPQRQVNQQQYQQNQQYRRNNAFRNNQPPQPQPRQQQRKNLQQDNNFPQIDLDNIEDII